MLAIYRAAYHCQPTPTSPSFCTPDTNMQGTHFVVKQRPNGLEGLQHTATHSNALQHTVTLCNILQHTTTHCNTLQHTATHCDTLQHTVNTLCNETTSKHIVFTYSLLHLEHNSISFSNLNPIGLFSLKGSKERRREPGDNQLSFEIGETIL